jgi:hypothetical protein
LDKIGQAEEPIKRILQLDDRTPVRNLPFRPEKLGIWTAKHLGRGAEQELQPVQIRPQEFVGQHIAGLFSVHLDIPRKYLPNIYYEPDSSGRGWLFSTQPGIPFSVNLDLPRNIIEGAPFPLYLSVKSLIEDWTVKSTSSAAYFPQNKYSRVDIWR